MATPSTIASLADIPSARNSSDSVKCQWFSSANTCESTLSSESITHDKFFNMISHKYSEISRRNDKFAIARIDSWKNATKEWCRRVRPSNITICCVSTRSSSDILVSVLFCYPSKGHDASSKAFKSLLPSSKFLLEA